MRLRAYTNLKPDAALSDPADLLDRLYDSFGPAVVDRSGWGLLRPGIITRRLVADVCILWKARRDKEPALHDRPQLRGNWVFFDYLFSKATSANPIIKCLTSVGLAKYGETKLTNTYLVTLGINWEQGLLLMLYNGKRIESELDELAYVTSRIVKASTPKLVEVTQKLLTESAAYLEGSPRWNLRGWVSRDGRSIELDLVEKNRDEYLLKLKGGEWRSLLFQDKYAAVKLTMGMRLKMIDIMVKRKYYNPGPKRDLKPTFDELSKAIRIDRVSEVPVNGGDEAGILRAYTERRGVIAALKLERERMGRDPVDVSYDFLGYDVKSDPYLVEVKAFKDSMNKVVQLTRNEYETMNKEENYCIYVVEDAWDNIPKVNVIQDPRGLIFALQSRTTLETKTTSEEYFECTEDRWRSKVTANYPVEA